MAFFRADTDADGEVLVPQERALSLWGGKGQLRGTAVSGVLARAAEHTADALDGAARFRPVRWTVDLFRPAEMLPLHVRAEVVREGRRLRLVDATAVQGDRTVARASALLLTTDSDPATGAVWQDPPPAAIAVPDLAPTTAEPTLYYSEGTGWTGEPGPHQNARRKMVWHLPDPLVDGEQPSPFQCAATVADSTNLVTSWGEHGVEFINTDVTLALTRRPAPDGAIGLRAERRTESEGIALTAAAMFDRAGPLGTVLVSTLANSANAVDPRAVGT